jgi:dihydrofolate reductase
VIVSHIVAMAENRVIGQGGTLPWHIPEDFKIFKRVTTGHALVMGRKTYESIGRPLPGRLSVVVTRHPERFPAPAGVEVCASIDDALALCAERAAQWGDEVFVIGGGEIFRETLPRAQRIYLTTVHREIQGDTFYPEIPADFRVVRSEPGPGEVPFTWQVLERGL